MNPDIAEFRQKCEEFYKGGSAHTIKDLDAFFVHATPTQRAELTGVQNAVRREYHASVEKERMRLFKELRASTDPCTPQYKKIVGVLKQFIEKHASDKKPGIGIFLVALYNVLRLQRNYAHRLGWILDDIAITENGEKDFIIDAYKLVVNTLGCEVIDRHSSRSTYVLPATLTNSELSAIARIFPQKVKRSKRILTVLQTDVEAGKSNKLATGAVYESTFERDSGYKEGILSQLYNYILDILF